MQIIYFGNDWQAENRTSSHHIAQRLSERFPLLYIESPGFRAPKATGRDFKKAIRKLLAAANRPTQLGPHFWRATIPQIPFRDLPFIPSLNRWLTQQMLRRAMRAVGFRKPVLWFVVPHTGYVARSLPSSMVVYYCIDDYASLPDIDQDAIRQLDEDLARRADQIFVSSPALLPAKSALNPRTVYSPHGVDVALFSRAQDPQLPIPEPAARLPHPVIGFFGLLEAWVDLELMRYIATQRPQWSLLLLGRSAVNTSALSQLPNVHMVGAQPYVSLPGWAKSFDVAIIPFRQNELVRNVNPLKLREYLATGKPVVSTPMPEVERFGDIVRVASTPETFLRALEEELSGDSEEKRARRSAAVATMTWESRVDEVLSIVEGRRREIHASQER